MCLKTLLDDPKNISDRTRGTSLRLGNPHEHETHPRSVSLRVKPSIHTQQPLIIMRLYARVLIRFGHVQRRARLFVKLRLSKHKLPYRDLLSFVRCLSTALQRMRRRGKCIATRLSKTLCHAKWRVEIVSHPCGPWGEAAFCNEKLLCFATRTGSFRCSTLLHIGTAKCAAFHVVCCLSWFLSPPSGTINQKGHELNPLGQKIFRWKQRTFYSCSSSHRAD